MVTQGRRGAKQNWSLLVVMWILAGVAFVTPGEVSAESLSEAVTHAVRSTPESLASQEELGKMESRVQEVFKFYLPGIELTEIEMERGDLVNWFWIDGVMEEMYDIVILTGTENNLALGFRCDGIRRFLHNQGGDDNKS
ncbi:MAG: hypothetical protein HQL50_03940 [Magnetococcales bacterium]|nr:hypothetical protein [Magnetococcales bacterium]